MKATVAIITRGRDPRLLSTVEQAQLTAPEGTEILVVWDGPERGLALSDDVRQVQTDDRPRGTSYARHLAMMEAENEMVITCDSHLDFPAGWVEAYTEHLAKYPKHVICSRCEMIGRGQGSIYHGADLRLKVEGPQSTGVCRKPGERQAVAAQWRSEQTAGPVMAVMGACYGMTKKNYKAMKAPWQYGTGWGCDEESISLAAWYMGGLCWLLPQVIGHHKQTLATYQKNETDGPGVLANRQRVIEMVTDDDARIDLKVWMGKDHAETLPMTELAELREYYKAKGRRTWADLWAKWAGAITRPMLIDALEQNGLQLSQKLRRAKRDQLLKLWQETEPEQPPASAPQAPPKLPPAPAGDVSQVIVRRVERCDRCNGIGTIKQIEGMRDLGPFGQANGRCKKCGHKAVIRRVA